MKLSQREIRIIFEIINNATITGVMAKEVAVIQDKLLPVASESPEIKETVVEVEPTVAD